MEKSSLPFAIVGLGKTGLSIARYLNKNKIDFIAYDTRENLEITNEINSEIKNDKIILGSFKEKYIDHHSNFILSPGISFNSNFLDKINKLGKKVYSDIDIFNQKKKNNVVCITGTNGKTTVTLLIEHMLSSLGKKAKAAGNVGLPVLDILEEEYDYHILELSSFQLETTKEIKSSVSLITNITEDHLDRHGTLENYVNVKHKIFKNSNVSVVNRLDKNIKKNNCKKEYSFGEDEPNDTNSFGVRHKNDFSYIMHNDKELISSKELNLIGSHNYINICSALAVIHALGLNLIDAVESLKKFQCVEHRMENFLESKNLIWINDSKSTNIYSTISAISSLDNDIVLLMGGRSKTNDYSHLDKVLKGKVKKLILFGESRYLIKQNITSINNISLVENIEEAAKKATNAAKILTEKTGKKVYILLSPACSSYDAFKSYEERGMKFKNYIFEKYRLN